MSTVLNISKFISSMPKRFNTKNPVNHQFRNSSNSQPFRPKKSSSNYPRNDYARRMDKKHDLLHVRELPKDMRHGIAMYKASTTKINNKLAKSHQSWINRYEQFANLNGIKYEPVKQINNAVSNYLTQIKSYYSALQEESDEALAVKINALETDWIKKIGKIPDIKKAEEKDSIEYKKELMKIKKSHSPIVYCNPKTGNFRYLSKCIDLLANRSTILFAFDIEAFEMDSNVVTEVGISIFDPRENVTGMVPITRNFHIIVSEALSLRNKKWVCDMKECYLLGQSVVLSLNETVEFVQSLINYYMVETSDATSKSWNRAYVGHNIDGDISWLQKIGVQIPFANKLNRTLIDDNKQNFKIPYVLDTMKLYNYCYGSNGCSLGKILRLFGLTHAFLHNAGNDAYYTLKLLMYMCDINFRKRFGLDDLDKFQKKAQLLLDRSKTEPKILPISYSITMKNADKQNKPKKDLVPQTEFGGSKWFPNANQAFENTIEYTGKKLY